MMRRFIGACSLVVLAACGDDVQPGSDADTPDVADIVPTDTHGTDGAETANGVDDADAAEVADPETSDTSEGDTGPDSDTPDAIDTVPLPGFGTITGPCGFLDDELVDPNPSFFVNAIDFDDDPYDINDFDRLTAHGQEMILDGNANSGSLYSEVFAMEVLARCELASLIATENEIVYDVSGKRTDMLVEIDGVKVGVSVVRAVGFPKDDPYTVAQATTVIEGKLDDILITSANVSDEFRWAKQILHVLAYADQHVESVEAAWESLSEQTRADTIVIVTVTHGDDLFMY